MLRSGSKIIVIFGITLSYANKEVFLGGVMCLVVVSNINPCIRFVDATKRVICSKDELMLIFYEHIPLGNFFGFCGTIVMSFATVNVKYIGTINVLKKLRRQLFCQQNTRSTHKNGKWCSRFLKTTKSVKNHDKSFTTASWNDDLPEGVDGQGIKGTLLVRPEFHGKCVSIQIVCHKKRGSSSPSAPSIAAHLLQINLISLV